GEGNPGALAQRRVPTLGRDQQRCLETLPIGQKGKGGFFSAFGPLQTRGREERQIRQLPRPRMQRPPHDSVLDDPAHGALAELVGVEVDEEAGRRASDLPVADPDVADGGGLAPYVLPDARRRQDTL